MPTLSPGNTIGEVAEIIHAAVVLGPAAWGRAPMPEAHMQGDIEDRLKGQLISLFQILHDRKIPYVLVGGIAMLTYIDGRNTDDVDLVLSVDSLRQLPEIVLGRRYSDFANGMFGDLKVDLRLTSNSLFGLVERSYARVHRFLEMDLRCASIEGMILLKLYSLPSFYRNGSSALVGQFETDICILHVLARPPLKGLLRELVPFVTSEEFIDLQVTIDDVLSRTRRLNRGSGHDAFAQ